MNREEKVLSVGYLVKSPTRSKDKSNLPMFWKLRWCVFARIAYSDRFGYVEDTKLLLSYYEDKKAYLNHEAPKGSLNITNCSGIRSCYKSHAGFDHLFCIEWSDGKYVKFSAQSCQKKFKWVTVLYNSKNDTVLKGVRRSEVISGDNARKQRPNKMNKRRSECFENLRSENLDSELRPISQSLSNLEDLGTTVCDVTNQASTQNGQQKASQISSPSSCRAMPLPPLPDELTDEHPMFDYHHDTRICIKDSQRKSRTFAGRGRSNEIMQRKQRRAATFTESDTATQCFNDYDNLFMLCEICQLKGSRKKNSLQRRLSSKKRGQLSRDEDAGCALKENEASQETDKEADDLSCDSVSSDELLQNDNKHIYVDIDDDWLEKVKLLMSKMEFIGDNGDVDDDVTDNINDYGDNDDDYNPDGKTTENKDYMDDFDGDNDNGDLDICNNNVDDGNGINKDSIKFPFDNDDNVDGAGDNDANANPEDGIYVKMNIFTFAPSIPVPQAVNLETKNAFPVPTNTALLPSGATPVPSEVTPVPPEATTMPSEVTPVPSTVFPVPSAVTPVPTKKNLLHQDTIPVLKDAYILPKDVASVTPKFTPVAREIPLMNPDTGPSTTDVTRVPKDVGLLPTGTNLMSLDANSLPKVGTPVYQNVLSVSVIEAKETQDISSASTGLLTSKSSNDTRILPSKCNKSLLASRQQWFVDISPFENSEKCLSQSSSTGCKYERTVDPELDDLFDSIDTVL